MLTFPRARFAAELVPVVPVGAKLTPNSKLKPDQLGKIPGRYYPESGRWSGLADFTKLEIDAKMQAEFASWPTPNWGLRAAQTPAIDIDSESPDIAELIEAVALRVLGLAPVRFRGNSPRRLLMYCPAGKPLTKQRRTWVDGAGVKHVIEILGAGQQYLVEGVHPSGAPYAWRSTCDFDLAPISAVQIKQFLDEVGEFLVLLFDCQEAVRHESGGNGDRFALGHPDHVASDFAELVAALNAIPNHFDYDSWIQLMAGFVGGCAGSPEGLAAFLEWSATNPRHDDDFTQTRWASLHETEIGARFVYGLAREHGWFGGVDDLDPYDGEEIDERRPVVRLAPGERLHEVKEADKHLAAAAAKLHVYQRGGLLVRPLLSSEKPKPHLGLPQLCVVTKDSLASMLGAAVRWEKYNARSKAYVAVYCPPEVAVAYLQSPWQWTLPTLAGVIHTPIIRPDGSILATPGYDAATQLLFDPQGETFPPVPDTVTKDQAMAAMAFVASLLQTVPFVSEVDGAVALSALVSSVIRRVLGPTPMHAFSAPVAGSGKSMLVDICSMLVNGRCLAVTAMGDEAETEKRIGASLIDGSNMLTLDNVEGRPLSGAVLCQILTQDEIKVRVLGFSKTTTAPCNVSLFSTGNNLIVHGDLTRRVLVCHIDPGVERPELLRYAGNPVEIAGRKRGEIVAAILTALRGFFGAQRPRQRDPLGSFEQWSRTVRDCLIWCGYADPCDSMEDARETDPQLEALIAVTTAWDAVFKDATVRARDLYSTTLADLAGETERTARQALTEALTGIAGDGRQGGISDSKLGYWLKANADRVIQGRKIKRLGSASRRLWQLVTVTGKCENGSSNG